MEPPRPKRVPPPDVDPIEVGGVRYEVHHSGLDHGYEQKGGYVKAVAASSGNELWFLQVYKTEYSGTWETDLEDVFLSYLSHEPETSSLVVDDTEGRSFRIDIATQSVSRIDD